MVWVAGLKVTFNNETGAIVCDPWYTGIMMERIAGKATEESVMRVLGGFRHGTRTNVARRVLDNRDAAAVLFWHLGPMRTRDIKRLLRQWRGKSNPSWNKGEPFDLAFTYLFNAGRHGNYGSVGQTAMTPGNWMYHGGGMVRHEKDFGMPGTNFRRTYWYRVRTGVYAPTVECAKRLFELGLQ